MDRRSFLCRVGLVGGAALVAPRVVTEILADPEVGEVPVVEAPAALVASGGLCAPLTPYYSLAMLPTSDRPLRSARITVE